MCRRRMSHVSDLVKHQSTCATCVPNTGKTVGHYLDTDADRAHNGANVQRASQAFERGRRACAEGPRGGVARGPPNVSRETL